MLAVGHDSIVVAALLVAKPDRGRGEPAVNAPSVWTGTVINVLMPAMTPLRKNSSRPSPDHRGWIPPCDEICHLPGPDGSWRTYTSERPDSLDSYANHFPSGEMAPPYAEGSDTMRFACRSPLTGSRKTPAVAMDGLSSVYESH